MYRAVNSQQYKWHRTKINKIHYAAELSKWLQFVCVRTVYASAHVGVCEVYTYTICFGRQIDFRTNLRLTNKQIEPISIRCQEQQTLRMVGHTNEGDPKKMKKKRENKLWTM